MIGANCILGKGVYIDSGVRLGANCKLQNGVWVYKGFTVDDGVFLGPGVMLLNDKNPRAINPDGTLKSEADWIVSRGHVGYGAAVGGGAVVLPGVNIGAWALIGSGTVVTKDVPPHGLVYGNPARLHGFVCPSAHKLEPVSGQLLRCPACGWEAETPLSELQQVS